MRWLVDGSTTDYRPTIQSLNKIYQSTTVTPTYTITMLPAFQPLWGYNAWRLMNAGSGAACATSVSESQQGILPLQLPQGAQLTQFSVEEYPYTGTFTLTLYSSARSQPLFDPAIGTPPTAIQISQLTASGNSTSIYPPVVVDNAHNHYYIWASAPAFGSSQAYLTSISIPICCHSCLRSSRAVARVKLPAALIVSVVGFGFASASPERGEHLTAHIQPPAFESLFFFRGVTGRQAEVRRYLPVPRHRRRGSPVR